MAETRTNADRVETITLAAGDTSSAIFVNEGAVCSVHPGGGGTMKAQATTSSRAAVMGGTARWIDWDLGAVSVASARVVGRVTAVRFVATGGSGHFAEVRQ